MKKGSHTATLSSSTNKKSFTELELIHTNVCGPMHTQSLNGSKYFILFVDDFSRYTWVYFMRMKSEAFQIFEKFKALVENEANLIIKTLILDNGTEFLSNRFEDLLQKSGILHQLSVPYSPQKTGVCERKNRAVLNMARCMLFEKMSKYF